MSYVCELICVHTRTICVLCICVYLCYIIAMQLKIHQNGDNVFLLRLLTYTTKYPRWEGQIPQVIIVNCEVLAEKRI